MKHSKIRTPISKGVAHVPFVMQLESLECGAASLCMCLAYYGKYIPLEQIRKDCGISRDGSNMKSLYLVAQKYGMEPTPYRFQTESLLHKGTFPCIVHWDFNHFVVLNGWRGKHVWINDPGRGLVKMSIDEFSKHFTGICLLMKPSADFRPEGAPPSMRAFTRERLQGTGPMFALIVTTSAIAAIIGIITPAMSRFYIDDLLATFSDATPFFYFYILIAVLQLGAVWIKSVYLLRLQGKMAIVANTSYVWHILRLPVDFFAQRMAGDLLKRQEANQEIASTLISTFAPIALDVITMLFNLFVMFTFSPLLAAVGVLSVVINLILSRIIARKRVNITRVKMTTDGKLNGMTISGIEMIETIKSAGAEKGFFTKWADYECQYNDQVVQYNKLDQYLGQIPGFINLLTGNIVLFLGVSLVMQGQWSVGVVSAFSGFLTAFTTPASSLIAAGQSYQEMRASMERIQDVLEYPVDVPDGPVDPDSLAGAKKLSGRLEMKNVTFGYNRLLPPLLKDFSMTLEPGKSVALVGPSGCGKSTLARLIMGTYEPWEGEVLYDGKERKEIDRNIFASSVAAVNQDIFLFHDTIANNIRLDDRSIEDFEIIMAARNADIHSFIVGRENGYDSMVAEGGRDMSGGQRQRIEIARALAQQPTLLILDEATSALDTESEHRIIKAIGEQNISLVIISHRLSIIRHCDEIIVLNRGEVADRGTHSELMARCESYQTMISNN